jgi:hypothetical protein
MLFSQVVVAILLMPTFALKIGFMVMSAMLIGAIVLENWKNLRSVCFVIVIFVMYQAWIHDSMFGASDAVIVTDKELVATLNIVMSLVILILWCVGMFLGIWIVSKTKKPYETERHILESELEDIVKRQTFNELQEFIDAGRVMHHVTIPESPKPEGD